MTKVKFPIQTRVFLFATVPDWLWNIPNFQPEGTGSSLPGRVKLMEY
jgi:hypothetical protein